MLCEETTEMTLADTDPAREAAAALLVEGAFIDEAEGALNGRSRSTPGGAAGRALGATTEAGAQASIFGRGRAREEADVRGLGRLHGADGTTVDARAEHADEESAVEPRIS